jgi:hypothetical protein
MQETFGTWNSLIGRLVEVVTWGGSGGEGHLAHKVLSGSCYKKQADALAAVFHGV